MTTKSITKLLILILLFVPFTGFQNLKAQETSNTGHWTVKLNLLSPLWQNLAGEVEYKVRPRLSLVAGVGFDRAFETLPELTGWECTSSRGFGVAPGIKYFLFLRESGKRSVDGIALKSTLNYTLDDEYQPLCITVLRMELKRTHLFGLNGFLSAQKTFFDRVVVEAQAGIGGSLQRIIIKNPEWPNHRGNKTQFSVQVPLAVNVGWTF